MQQQQFRIFRALGLSFKAWFSNFIPFTVLAAVVYAPVVIWILAYPKQSIASSDDMVEAYFGRPIYLLIALSSLLAPLLTYRVIQGLNGTRVSILTSTRFGMRGIVPAVCLAVILNVVQLLPGAGGILSAIMSCIWFVTTPAAVAERLSPFAAFSRSAELTKGRRWGIFGLSLLVSILAVGLMLIWVIPALQDTSDAAASLAIAQRTSLLVVLTLGLFQLFTSVVQAVAYALLRQDKDGVSYEELARVFE